MAKPFLISSSKKKVLFQKKGTVWVTNSHSIHYSYNKHKKGQHKYTTQEHCHFGKKNTDEKSQTTNNKLVAKRQVVKDVPPLT